MPAHSLFPHPDQDQPMTLAAPYPSAGTLSKPSGPRKLRRSFILTAVLAVIFIIILAIVQNLSANRLLAEAISLDKNGSYQKASEKIEAANKLFVLPQLKKSIAAEESKNVLWQGYQAKQFQAESLIKRKKYADAINVLKSIGAEYPGYSAIQKDLQVALSAVDGVTAPKQAAAGRSSSNTVAPKPVTKPPAKVAAKRFTSTSALNALAAATSISAAQSALQSFLGQYGAKALVSSFVPSSYAKQYSSFAHLSTAQDLANLKAYGAEFIDEWSKYPVDWVKNSDLKGVAFVKSFSVSGTNRAAMADIVGYVMYYDVGYGVSEYTREVIHHEYDHLIQYVYRNPNSINWDDPTWTSYNPPGFRYGNGGASAYVDPRYVYTFHPAAGFVTSYATYAIEEDKAETYGFLMDSNYYQSVKSWIKSDGYLAKKVSSMKQLMCSHSSSMCGGYLDQINP